MGALDYQPRSLDGKTAVVVGGTSGLGEAIAFAFASEGASVVPASRSAARVDDTVDRFDDEGLSVDGTTVDVRDTESVRRLREYATERFGGVDVLVTSQGAIAREALRDSTEESWEHVLDVAQTGTYRACRTFADAMDEGSVVTVSSLAARLALPGLVAYATAKGGVEAFTRAAARDLAPNVRVNAIAPGFVITPQNEAEYAEGTEKRESILERTPLNRFGEREEIAAAAVFLASDAASFVTGEVLTVDGGYADSAL